jgi:hypothetical protein
MSVIHTALVDLNVFSIRIVHEIKAVPVTDVSIHARELAESTPIVELRITFLFAVVKKPIPEILMDLVVLYPPNVSFFSNKKKIFVNYVFLFCLTFVITV